MFPLSSRWFYMQARDYTKIDLPESTFHGFNYVGLIVEITFILVEI